MNDTLRTIAARYSCRAFDGKLPEREKLEAIAMAAIQSPSAMNLQPWKIIVITDKPFIDEMDEDGVRTLTGRDDKSAYDRVQERGGKMFYNAPCMFLIVKPTGTGFFNVDMDCGIVCENISLAAASLGLGSVICGMAGIPFLGTNGDLFTKKAGIPDDWGFGIAVLVGYAAEPGAPHEPDKSKISFV